MLRSLSILLAAALLLCGCSRTAQEPIHADDPIQQEEVLLPSEGEADPAAMGAAQTRTVDGALTLDGEQLSVDLGPVLHVLSDGSLTANGLALDRIAGVRDETRSVLEQAAIVVESGGQATLTSSALASDASRMPLLYTRGNAELSDTTAVLSGTNAAMLFVSNGGSVRTLRSTLFTDGAGSVCICAENGGSVECADNTQLTAEDPDGGAMFLVDGGKVSISGGTVSGRIRFFGTGNALHCTGTSLTGDLCFDNAEDEIDLRLLSGSVFTGTTDGESAMGVSVTLDAESRWVLTGDAYVAALHNADETLSNIESNGHTLYYNAEAEANSWLGARSIALSGGGYLIPLI